MTVSDRVCEDALIGSRFQLVTKLLNLLTNTVGRQFYWRSHLGTHRGRLLFIPTKLVGYLITPLLLYTENSVPVFSVTPKVESKK